MAYANSDIRGAGSGCVLWFEDLIDLKQIQTGGQDLYIRMSASELGDELHNLLTFPFKIATLKGLTNFILCNPPEHKNNKPMIVASTVAAICVVLILCSYFIYRIYRNKAGNYLLTILLNTLLFISMYNYN